MNTKNSRNKYLRHSVISFLLDVQHTKFLIVMKMKIKSTNK